MPKLQVNTTNFTAGEFSPLLAGRTDIEKYNSSAKTLSNVVVLKQGGATIRPPLCLQGETKFSLLESRLIGFIYSRTDAYQLEFGNLYIRVWKNNALLESSPGVPYEIVSPFLSAELADIDFTQGEDTMILAHGSHHPKRLRRFADTRWVLDDVPFAPGAVSEMGHQTSASMTISAGTVGAGRTITASSASFLAADVGRVITWGGGSATITGYTSTLIVTATVTAVFADLVAASPAWRLLDSPMTTLTASAKDPVGATITLTLGAAGWRDETGCLVEINGGLARITSMDAGSPTTIANAVILRELSSVVAAPADAWALLRPIWTAGYGYPRSCAFYQQRLWFGNTVTYPQSVWGSRSALYFDFTPGTDDDSAIYKTVAATDEVNPLQFLCGASSLVMLGYGAEIEGKGGIEKPITQTNMQINAQSEWGCAPIRPMTVGKEILFAERGGKTLRAIFPQQVDGYDSTDVSVFSEHLLASGIKAMAYERKPNSVLWVAPNDGSLVAFTYNREQNTLAWCSGGTDGDVESLSTIPSATADVTTAIVKRTINGVTKRYVERLDWTITDGLFDCRILQSFGSRQTVIPNLGALEGKTVHATADQVFMGKFVVTGGAITLPRGANDVVVGLPYTATIVLPPPEVGTGTGTSTGQAKSTSRVQVRLHQTIGLKVNGKDISFRSFGSDLLDVPPALFTGLKGEPEYGWGDDEETDLTLSQEQGYPWTVLAVIRTITVNAG